MDVGTGNIGMLVLSTYHQSRLPPSLLYGLDLLHFNSLEQPPNNGTVLEIHEAKGLRLNDLFDRCWENTSSGYLYLSHICMSDRQSVSKN